MFSLIQADAGKYMRVRNASRSSRITAYEYYMGDAIYINIWLTFLRFNVVYQRYAFVPSFGANQLGVLVSAYDI